MTFFSELDNCIADADMFRVSMASYEKSISKLKLILTYLRASMSQSRLNSLALLSIEKETVNSIDFTSIIDEFASMKARRVHLQCKL